MEIKLYNNLKDFKMINIFLLNVNVNQKNIQNINNILKKWIVLDQNYIKKSNQKEFNVIFIFNLIEKKLKTNNINMNLIQLLQI